MEPVTHHPLYAKADAFKRAFVLNGFVLHDDGMTPEAETSDWAVQAFPRPKAVAAKPVLLEEEGAFAMRSDLIVGQLASIAQDAAIDALAQAAKTMSAGSDSGLTAGPFSAAPVNRLVVGRVFDHDDPEVPVRTMVEGVIASGTFSMAAYEKLWQDVAAEVYGLGIKVSLVPAQMTPQLLAAGTTLYSVEAVQGDDRFTLAYTGPATRLAQSLLHTLIPGIETWIFSLCIDDLVMHDLGIEDRKALYSPLVSFLGRFRDNVPTLGPTPFLAQVANVLRLHGYMQFTGIGLYESDAYEKMNMIMESWDLNNRGYLLKEPLGSLTRMPTVLTPSLEDALEANVKAGEPEAKIFEINHHYILPGLGQPPKERLSISFGAYGPDLDKGRFRDEVFSVLDAIGVSNHYPIPIDMAIPYDPANCNILMDEAMQYLGGQFGSVNPIALERHGVDGPWFIFQCEVDPLAAKAQAEFGFIPDELS